MNPHKEPPRIAPRRLARLLALALPALMAPAIATANERHFGNTYETGVLPPGAKEIEVWTTGRLGREDYYAAMDHRVEFEVGLSSRLMTSLYLNFSGQAADVTDATGMKSRVTSFEYQGISSEWKLKLTDPVADPFGFGLYGEVSLAPTGFELEAKALLDKKIGNLLLAANLVGAAEAEFEPGGGAEPEIEEYEAVVDLAAGYFVRPSLLLGLELENHNEIKGGEWEHSALYAGPVVAYAEEAWWVTFTVMPQLPALKSEHGAGHRDLEEHEALVARLLFSFHIE